MLGKTTLPRMYWPLMEGPSVIGDRCCVCGRAYPLNQHHVVRRSAGKLFMDGEEVEKPVITLCGWGNNLRGPDGMWCHGMAHANMLHFRYVGRWEYLITREPTKYENALAIDGWRPVKNFV